MTRRIFVFGSNEGGIHGAGAARYAYQHHGAAMGCGFGHVGNSFAIPTKDQLIQHTLPLQRINQYVQAFLAYASGRPDLEFQVTCIGCGLAGLRHQDVAPMFKNAPSNCLFDTLWMDIFDDPRVGYWGTF